MSSESLENSEFWVRTEKPKGTDIMNLSMVGFDLKIKRKSGSFLYEFFLPCLLMVMTSWASFAIMPEAVPGRLGLLITLLLMLVNMSSSISQTIPKSDSICPLVAWILLSIVFVIVALVEYFAILLRVKFLVGKSKVSVKSSDIEENDKKIKQWANKLDMTFLALLPPVYIIAVLMFIAII